MRQLTYAKGITPTGAQHVRIIRIWPDSLDIYKQDFGATSEGSINGLTEIERDERLARWQEDLESEGFAITNVLEV